MAVAAITLLFGFIEFIDPIAFREALGLPIVQRQRGDVPVMTSLFAQPGLFGWFTAFCSLFLYAYFLVFRRWWLIAAALLLNVGTVLSGRRRPLVGLAAAFVVAVGWQVRSIQSLGRAVRTAAPLLAAGVLLVAVSLPFLGGFYASTIETYFGDVAVVTDLAFGDHQLDEDQADAIPARTALYAASVAVARDHFPLGAGLGRYGSHVSRLFYSPLYAEYGLSDIFGLRQARPIAVVDTFWPMLLGETGIFGLLAYAGFVAAILVSIWRFGHATESQRHEAFYLAALLVMLLSLVESLVAPSFIAPPVAYVSFAVAGAAMALRSAEEAAA
jgi:hypothetical protein